MNERKPIYHVKVTPYFTATGRFDPIIPDSPMPSIKLPAGWKAKSNGRSKDSSGLFQKSHNVGNKGGVKTRGSYKKGGK